MNILWIEDFDTKLDQKDAIQDIFGGLLGNCLDGWIDNVPGTDLSAKPGQFSDYVDQKDLGIGIKIIRHIFDYKELINGGHDLSRDYDVILIDINLTRMDENLKSEPIPALTNEEDLEEGEEVPKGQESKEEFHKKAGFHIYHNLLHLQYPSQNIRFLTGESNTCDDFIKDCKKAYIPKPKYYQKGAAGYKSLGNFLKAKRSDPYLSTRRFMLNVLDEIESNQGVKLDSAFSKDLDKKALLESFSWMISINVAKKDMQKYNFNICDSLTKPFDRFNRNSLKNGKLRSGYPKDETRKYHIRSNFIPLNILRNWIGHGVLSLVELDFEDTLFVFILAINAYFNKNILDKAVVSLSGFQVNQEIDTLNSLVFDLKKNFFSDIDMVDPLEMVFKEFKRDDFDKGKFKLNFYSCYIFSNCSHELECKPYSRTFVVKFSLMDNPLNAIAAQKIKGSSPYQSKVRILMENMVGDKKRS